MKSIKNLITKWAGQWIRVKMRIIYFLPTKKIKGPWVRYSQEKVDDVFDLMDGIAGNEINYLQVNDNKGSTFIISPELAQKLIVKIETKYRLF